MLAPMPHIGSDLAPSYGMLLQYGMPVQSLENATWEDKFQAKRVDRTKALSWSFVLISIDGRCSQCTQLHAIPRSKASTLVLVLSF